MDTNPETISLWLNVSIIPTKPRKITITPLIIPAENNRFKVDLFVIEMPPQALVWVIFSPRIPEGRMIRINTRMVKAIASLS